MFKKPKLTVFSAVVVLALLLNLFILMVPEDVSANKLPSKGELCNFVGCSGGPRLCAEIEGSVNVPGIGSISVKYFCYEMIY